MRSLKIGSLNINGGRDSHKRALVSEVSSQKRTDVLFLQVTHSAPADETDWGIWWGGPYALSHGSNVSAGVAVSFTAAAGVTIVSSTEVVNGRLLVVRAETESSVFCFVNVYAPSQGPERVIFFTQLQNELNKYHQV